MYSEQNYRTLSFKDITIEGFSRAAAQTYWRIPEMKLGFDLGAQPWTFMGTPNWFVSHTHMDHLLALPAYVARRRMMLMEPPTIYLPEEGVEMVRELLRVYSRLDRGKLPCNLIGLAPGDEVDLSRELVVTVSRTYHTVPSLGYIVWERRKKLKAEYLQLSGEEIRDLNRAGVEVSREIRLPKLAYFGDSTIRALDECPDMYEASVLILEATFVAPGHRKDAIRKFGHVHLDDLKSRRKKFKNELIIASHFSSRYHEKEIQYEVRRSIPDFFDGKLMLWI